MGDSFVAWAHSMHMGIAADEAHSDHMTGHPDLDMVLLLVDWLEDHMFGALVTACHMMVACHTAAEGHTQIEDLAVHILAEKTHAHKDAGLHGFHTSLHIHVRSYAEQ